MKLLDRIGGALEKGVGGLENVGSGIGSILAQMGGGYAPSDLDLSDRQKRGLLSANISDRIYGPGANATPQAPEFLDRIRTDKQRIDLRNGILNYPGLSAEDQALYGNAPPSIQQQLLNDISGRRFGTSGQATSSLTPQIFEKPDGTFVFGQVNNRGTGIRFPDGTSYDPVANPEQAEWTLIGTSMNTSVDRRGDIAQEVAESEVAGRAAGDYKVFTNDDYMRADADYASYVAGSVQQARTRAENNEDLVGAAREAELGRIEELEDGLNNSFARTSSKEVQFTLLTGLFDQAREQASRLSTGLSSQALGGIGGTAALELQKTLDAIAANVGFDKLQAMRDLSKTGGALGNVSNVELNLLTSSLGSLSTEVGYDTFLTNLERVQTTTGALWDQAQDNFRREFNVDYFDPNSQQLAKELISERRTRLLDVNELSGTDESNPFNSALRARERARRRGNQ
tara:strand:+ start:152 stop:1519 length:1368 start_codon:yes stop_codon:yes gene_type:complete